jgi:hypothetical protein
MRAALLKILMETTGKEEAEIRLRSPREATRGVYSSPVAFSFSPDQRREILSALTEALKETPLEVRLVEGHLNFHLRDRVAVRDLGVAPVPIPLDRAFAEFLGRLRFMQGVLGRNHPRGEVLWLYDRDLKTVLKKLFFEGDLPGGAALFENLDLEADYRKFSKEKRQALTTFVGLILDKFEKNA